MVSSSFYLLYTGSAGSPSSGGNFENHTIKDWANANQAQPALYNDGLVSQHVVFFIKINNGY